MGCGNGDANAREASGPDADDNLRGDAPVHHFSNHRHQPLGMAASDDFVGASDARTLTVEQGDSAGGARRVESQKHGWDSGHKRLNAASPRKLDGFD
jgi:hypothetical protein